MRNVNVYSVSRYFYRVKGRLAHPDDVPVVREMGFTVNIVHEDGTEREFSLGSSTAKSDEVDAVEEEVLDPLEANSVGSGELDVDRYDDVALAAMNCGDAAAPCSNLLTLGAIGLLHVARAN